MSSMAAAMAEEFERIKKELQEQAKTIEEQRQLLRDLRLENERLKLKCGEGDEQAG